MRSKDSYLRELDHVGMLSVRSIKITIIIYFMLMFRNLYLSQSRAHLLKITMEEYEQDEFEGNLDSRLTT